MEVPVSLHELQRTLNSELSPVTSRVGQPRLLLKVSYEIRPFAQVFIWLGLENPQEWRGTPWAVCCTVWLSSCGVKASPNASLNLYWFSFLSGVFHTATSWLCGSLAVSSGVEALVFTSSWAGSASSWIIPAPSTSPHRTSAPKYFGSLLLNLVWFIHFCLVPGEPTLGTVLQHASSPTVVNGEW